MKYIDKLKDPRWQRLRLEVFQRDNFTCKDCRRTDRTLHVHHCKYQGRNPWETEPKFLITLCDKCHEQRAEIESAAKASVQESLAMLFATHPVEELHEVSATSDHDVEWLSLIRWFRYAVANPQFRKAYEDVTGIKPKWDWEYSDQKDSNA